MAFHQDFHLLTHQRLVPPQLNLALELLQYCQTAALVLFRIVSINPRAGCWAAEKT